MTGNCDELAVSTDGERAALLSSRRYVISPLCIAGTDSFLIDPYFLLTTPSDEIARWNNLEQALDTFFDVAVCTQSNHFW